MTFVPFFGYKLYSTAFQLSKKIPLSYEFFKTDRNWEHMVLEHLHLSATRNLWVLQTSLTLKVISDILRNSRYSEYQMVDRSIKSRIWMELFGKEFCISLRWWQNVLQHMWYISIILVKKFYEYFAINLRFF